MQGAALWRGYRMLGNTFGRSWNAICRQPRCWAGQLCQLPPSIGEPRENWAASTMISTIQAGPQLYRDEISAFLLLFLQEAETLLSSQTLPLVFNHAIPFPSPCSSSSTAMLCQDATPRSRHRSSSSLVHPDRGLGPLIPPCHHHRLGLTQWVVLIIIDSRTKLWTPVTARQLAGSAGNSNAHGYIRQGSELLRLFFLIDDRRIKSDTWWCLACYVWMKPFLAVLIFSSHKSNKRPSCALLSTQPPPASKFSLAKWTIAASLQRGGTRDGAPEGVTGEPCVDDDNLKKILQNIRAEDRHWFTHEPERLTFLLSIAFSSDITSNKYLVDRDLSLMCLIYTALWDPMGKRDAV